MKIGACVLVLCAAVAVWAVPYELNYQGYLTRPDGTPLDTTVAMTFQLYLESYGDLPYWTEIQPQVQVTNGLFRVALGHYTFLSDNLLGHSSLWLGVTVGADGEMAPRTEVVSVPYARRVGSVDFASGGTIIGKTKIGWSNVNTGDSSFVIGSHNSAYGNHSTISGGDDNRVDDPYGVVGGGRECWAQGQYSTIGGGYANATLNAQGTVSGGFNNNCGGISSTISGGYGNTTSGVGSTVPGGSNNTAGGNYSFAAGRTVNVAGESSFGLGTNITCVAESAFVWSDGTSPTLSIGSSRTFSVKATNGTRIWTAPDLSIGVTLTANDNTWNSVCDRNLKTDVRPVDGAEILAKVSQLPISRWRFKNADPTVEHISPMAQDFWSAFHVGSDSLKISTLDPGGIALAAIQELAKQNAELKHQVTELQAQVQSMLAPDRQTHKP